MCRSWKWIIHCQGTLRGTVYYSGHGMGYQDQDGLVCKGLVTVWSVYIQNKTIKMLIYNYVNCGCTHASDIKVNTTCGFSHARAHNVLQIGDLDWTNYRWLSINTDAHIICVRLWVCVYISV